MRQGRSCVALWAMLALSCAVLSPLVTGDARAAKTTSEATEGTSRKAANTLRQFTGYVTSLDAQSITVEKRGKKPATRTFTKHTDMKSTGDVEKEARVTVYYRESGGRSVAHKVVVRPEVKSRS